MEHVGSGVNLYSEKELKVNKELFKLATALV